MEITLICEKKYYNFSLPLDVNLNYIKKLCSKIFKSESLDIYYKGDKITKEENEEQEENEENDDEKILLKDIVNDASNVKLKIVLNSTFNNSTKNQTPSTTNTPEPTKKANKTIDFGGHDININPNKILLSKSKSNKLFEAIYTQKTKKLFLSIKEFNKKIIEIDNFLFKKKQNFKNDNLAIFEKKLYDFIDRIRLYFNKLYSMLEINNYISYNEMIKYLKIFYNEIDSYEGIEPENNCQTTRENDTITSTPINKFPINLKKSENILSLNPEKCLFNKSSKKPTIKKALLLSNNNNIKLKNNFEIKTSLLNEIKTTKNNEKTKFIKLTNNEKDNTFNLNENKKNEDKKDEDNNENNNEKNIDKTNNEENEENKENKDNKENDKNNKNTKILDLRSTKNVNQNLSEKSLSTITKKTNNSNKNDLNDNENENDSNKNDSNENSNSNENDLNSNEEDVNNDNNISQNSNTNTNSNKSLTNNKDQKVPFNLELINGKKSNKDINLYEEIKIPKMNQFYNQNKKKNTLSKQYLTSTIQENENENFTNSSYDNTNNNNSKNNSHNSNKIDNKIKKKKKTIIKKDKEKTIKENKEDENISKLYKELTSINPINQTRQSVKINSYPKAFSIEKNINQNFEKRKSVLDPPIYHISTTSNDTEMAQVLSRKAIMKKKKNKTSNKYDFLI